MEALIYCRNSAGVARSVEEQEAEARTTCERNGWTVKQVIVDLVGASRHSKGTRDGWARARTIIKAHDVDVLVTWEASRAQRDLEAYAELRALCADAGVLWSYSGNVYDLRLGGDRFRTGLDALLAEREAEETSERVRRAMRANAVQGRPHGRRLLGYRRIYDPATGALVGQEPDPEGAALVRRIFDLFLSGIGPARIARILNDEGIGTSTGALWNESKVRRVLDKPSYAGKRVHQGEVIGDAGWPPIIDEVTFERAQRRLEAGRGRRPASQTNLLTAVGRCGKCGGRLRRKNTAGIAYYVCSASYDVTRQMVPLDQWVTDRLLERLADPSVAERDHAPVDDDLRSRRDAAAARLDEAKAAFVAGTISAATLGAVEGELLAVVADLNAEMRRHAYPAVVDVPNPRRIKSWWNHLLPEQQRAVVGAFIASVTIHTGRGPADETTIDIEFL